MFLLRRNNNNIKKNSQSSCESRCGSSSVSSLLLLPSFVVVVELQQLIVVTSAVWGRAERVDQSRRDLRAVTNPRDLAEKGHDWAEFRRHTSLTQQR